MAACMDVVLPYVHGGSSSGTDRRVQLMQGKIADMYTTLNACRRSVCGRQACDRGETRARMGPARSLCGGEGDVDGRRGIQALGGNGYIKDYATGRLWRDPSVRDRAGTSESADVTGELFNETK